MRVYYKWVLNYGVHTVHYCLLQEKLVDGAVVQFYHRPSQLFLGVHGTEVTLIDDEEDNKSNVTEYFEEEKWFLCFSRKFEFQRENISRIAGPSRNTNVPTYKPQCFIP